MCERLAALKAFLDSAHSVYHAVDFLVQQLEGEGYTLLRENVSWELQPGGKYYMTRGGSALVAFRIPAKEPVGFMLSASHADRPAFKVKKDELTGGVYTRLATEKYGGMLIAPWLDRPLSVAGRVIVETQEGISTRLVDIDRDLLVIPNVAILMNRNANEGQNWNPAVDTLPLIGDEKAAGKFWKLMEQTAGGRILGSDLYLYLRHNASVWGLDEKYISAQALDDLMCAWGCTRGFLQAEESRAIPVLSVFDCEEVGSATVQGAGSHLLQDVLTRIAEALELDLRQLLSNSLMLSADNAHAKHPNHPELSDSTGAPVMNGGVVIKYNANQRYTTDGLSAALVTKICEDAGVPVQAYYNRADLPGGSTLGCISLAQVTVLSADIGLAQLAMHSCWETAGAEDILYLEDAMMAFYSSALEQSGDGLYNICKK